MYINSLILCLVAATRVSAHMHLEWPPTLKGDNNPYTREPDQRLNYPYGCCGQTNTDPCKGHLGLLDTEEGTPVVEWQAGAKVNFTLSGNSIKNTNDQVVGGTHYGGSCQVGFSTDKGKTFKVATTWQGSCPHRQGTIDPATQVFDFVIPADLPAGDAVFAWTWVNREQEFNMNCASVRITGGAGNQQPESPSSTQPNTSPQPTPTASYTLEGCSCTCPLPTFTDRCRCQCEKPSAHRRLVERKALALHVEELRRRKTLNVPVRRAEMVAFSARPDMLFLDFDGTGCTSVGTSVELSFPDPGPDVVEGDGEYQLAPPVGNCGGGS